MELREKIYIYWVTFGGLILGTLILCCQIHYLETDFNIIINSLCKIIIGLGLTFYLGLFVYNLIISKI